MRYISKSTCFLSLLRANRTGYNPPFPPLFSRRPSRMSSGSKGKRPASHGGISPPPVKRKTQSAISKDVVASFFTPTSQKPKERTIWTERAPSRMSDNDDKNDENDDRPATLLVARYTPEGQVEEENIPKRRKIAAFDLDSTLITTSSGKKHADGPGDWKWWDHCVPSKLKSLYYDDGYRVVIFTNQGGLTLHPDPKGKGPKYTKARVGHFKSKCNSVLTRLDLPITLYAATAKDIFRKPRPGMWREMLDDYGLTESDVDYANSVFVGDAGGRMAQLGEKGSSALPKDFSCCDRNLAYNIGIAFQTPEEYFLGEAPRDFTRDFDLAHHVFKEEEDPDQPLFQRTNKKDVILFCGPPGAGKSTFYWKHLKPLGYGRVNQDTLKNKEKCLSAAVELLKSGVSVVIDNTNADPDTRAQWTALATKRGVPIRCLWFKTPLHLAQHNDAVRAMNKAMNPESRQGLPTLAFNGFRSRFKEPKTSEGFQDVVEIEFTFRGTEEEYAIWSKYWL